MTPYPHVCHWQHTLTGGEPLRLEERQAGWPRPNRLGGLSRTARSYVYTGKRFNKTKSGYKYNCIEKETGVTYWISGPKKSGGDRLYGESSRFSIVGFKHDEECAHLLDKNFSVMAWTTTPPAEGLLQRLFRK